MKRDDYLKHLDRAFTQAPPELTASVEEAFRRGEEAMKQRHKIMTALSVAAAIAVLCAALALAAGTMLKPRRDSVVGERGSAQACIPLSRSRRPSRSRRCILRPKAACITTPMSIAWV